MTTNHVATRSTNQKEKKNQISNRLLHLKNKNKKSSTECSMHNAIQRHITCKVKIKLGMRLCPLKRRIR